MTLAPFFSASEEPKKPWPNFKPPRMSPASCDAAHNLGLCFHAEGWFVEAVAEFDEALSRVESSEREDT